MLSTLVSSAYSRKPWHETFTCQMVNKGDKAAEAILVQLLLLFDQPIFAGSPNITHAQFPEH